MHVFFARVLDDFNSIPKFAQIRFGQAELEVVRQDGKKFFFKHLIEGTLAGGGLPPW